MYIILVTLLILLNSLKTVKKHFPDWAMNADLWLTGTLIGTMQAPTDKWYENDGIVNTFSMHYPFRSDGTEEPICEFTGKSKPGCWQQMKRLHVDHHQVIGHGFFNNNVDFLKNYMVIIAKF